MLQPSGREDRFHPHDRPPDQRTPGQRDRDRILYTNAFRRLAGVTQVAVVAEKFIFHTRLTHTLEVAQIGRRLAEFMLAESSSDLIEELGGLDPDVVEAASLAHDLGHPPFGHIAEEELDDLVKKSGIADGFEGNAQSFRIVTKLALRYRGIEGLNLTRATLNAVLKYPWFRQTGGQSKDKKWGAYHNEEKEFLWARESSPGDENKSLEAELMDWADDIAYSVHDVEDFYQAGLIPLDRLIGTAKERGKFLGEVFERWKKEEPENKRNETNLSRVFEQLFEFIAELFPSLHEPYSGNTEQAASLRSLTASLIDRYIRTGISPRNTPSKLGRRVDIDEQHKMEIDLLKQLTWHYVIKNPALASQQYGQRRVIQDLYKIFKETAVDPREGRRDVFPIRYRERLQELGAHERDAVMRTRIVVDLISGMTEQQAFEMHQRLTGISPGSLLDPIVS